MAFTFAHPAAVIPLQKYKNQFHFTALVLGAMAPDFEYFLFGKPMQVAGHTLGGLFTVNLPLVLVVWVLYEAFVRDAVLQYMPSPFWRSAQTLRRLPRYIRHAQEAWVFAYSAILGMLTHLVWDAFTHRTGLAVHAVPFLQQAISIGGLQVPIYKILQHGTTLVGLVAIVWFLFCQLKRADLRPAEERKTQMARQFWIGIIGLSGLVFLAFCLLVFDGSLGGLVVGVIDSALLALLAVSVWDHFRHERENACG